MEDFVFGNSFPEPSSTLSSRGALLLVGKRPGLFAAVAYVTPPAWTRLLPGGQGRLGSPAPSAGTGGQGRSLVFFSEAMHLPGGGLVPAPSPQTHFWSGRLGAHYNFTKNNWKASDPKGLFPSP